MGSGVLLLGNKRLVPLKGLDDERELMVHEVYSSIQGESSYAGRPCTFIRTTACHLRCHYCDTPHAFYEGKAWSIDRVVNTVRKIGHPLVELTGGEPLLQGSAVALMRHLCDEGYEVLLETSGSLDISVVDPRVVCIMDLKTPSSGEEAANDYANIEHLMKHHEVKLVLGDRADYEWAKEILERFELSKRCTVLMGPVYGRLELAELAQWILADHLPVRLQVQMHKVIWEPYARGV
jgi:7-carboxy-7-deazaguanine synthase